MAVVETGVEIVGQTPKLHILIQNAGAVVLPVIR